jgi:hypothetical protein
MKEATYTSNMFIKGPIDVRLLSIANEVKSIDVLLVIWLQSSLEKSLTIHLKPSLFTLLGIERTKRYRGIRKLQEAGVLRVVENRTGRTCTVELVKENLGRFLPF